LKVENKKLNISGYTVKLPVRQSFNHQVLRI